MKMKIFLAIFGLCLVLDTVYSLHGGNAAILGQYPSQVAINLPGGQICSGTIIDTRHVVTAASCILDANRHLINANQVTIQAGVIALAPTAPVIQAVALFPHPEYSPFTQEHDIAVIRIQNNFTFNFEIANPPIAPAEIYLRIVPQVTQCIVAGWNAPTAAVPIPSLNVISVPVRARADCNAANVLAGTVRESMICAGNDGANNPASICPSTRGAGLFCQGRFVGVASFGFACGNGNLPGSYTQLRMYNDWIVQQFNRTQIPLAGPTPHPGSTGTLIAASMSLFSLAVAMFIIM